MVDEEDSCESIMVPSRIPNAWLHLLATLKQKGILIYMHLYRCISLFIHLLI